MKPYLLDTSALLTLRDNEPGAVAWPTCCRRGRLAYEQSLPLVWIHESSALLVRAGELKARHPLSLADAWIAACAAEEGATLVHKDPEFQAVPIEQQVLTLKK